MMRKLNYPYHPLYRQRKHEVVSKEGRKEGKALRTKQHVKHSGSRLCNKGIVYMTSESLKQMYYYQAPELRATVHVIDSTSKTEFK